VAAVPTVQIAAVRIQPQWSSRRRPLVHCVATLTRPLTPAERDGLGRFPEFSVSEDRVTFSCRPEETEESEQRLAGALQAAARHRRGLRSVS